MGFLNIFVIDFDIQKLSWLLEGKEKRLRIDFNKSDFSFNIMKADDPLSLEQVCPEKNFANELFFSHILYQTIKNYIFQLQKITGK